VDLATEVGVREAVILQGEALGAGAFAAEGVAPAGEGALVPKSGEEVVDGGQARRGAPGAQPAGGGAPRPRARRGHGGGRGGASGRARDGGRPVPRSAREEPELSGLRQVEALEERAEIRRHPVRVAPVELVLLLDVRRAPAVDGWGDCFRAGHGSSLRK